MSKENPKKRRFIVWRKMSPFYNHREGYSASEADALNISATVQVMIIFDPETSEQTHYAGYVVYRIGGDTIGNKDGSYEILLPWLQDKIDQAIRDNLRANREKQDIQVED